MVVTTLPDRSFPFLSLMKKLVFSLVNQQRAKAGENYTAPNGRQVPVSITYTDKAGGEAHYINVEERVTVEGSISSRQPAIFPYSGLSGASGTMGKTRGSRM